MITTLVILGAVVLGVVVVVAILRRPGPVVVPERPRPRAAGVREAAARARAGAARARRASEGLPPAETGGDVDEIMRVVADHRLTSDGIESRPVGSREP